MIVLLPLSLRKHLKAKVNTQNQTTVVRNSVARVGDKSALFNVNTI